MVVQFIVFLTLSTLICRGTDISKCLSESLGIRDNESRLYYFSSSQVNSVKFDNISGLSLSRTCPGGFLIGPTSDRYQIRRPDIPDIGPISDRYNIFVGYFEIVLKGFVFSLSDI